jgi:hypothetical protein
VGGCAARASATHFHRALAGHPIVPEALRCPAADGSANGDNGVGLCQPPVAWHLQGWCGALVDWGVNALLASNFDEAAPVLHAAWSFVQDHAHSSATAPSSGCQHCMAAAAAAAESGQAKAGEPCWLVGYLRNLCTQAVLAKEEEEAQFVLEGFQDPRLGVREL